MTVHAVPEATGRPAQIGFVVSKTVGNAVVRNRVKRRLRHAMRAQLALLPESLVVVRAKPASATADFRALSLDLERCLSKVKDGAT